VAQEPPASEYLPLAMAAAATYVRVVEPQEHDTPSRALLDVVASALSVWIPIFGSRAPGAPRVRLGEREVARGAFCDGATRLRFKDGASPIASLAVLQADLEAGIRQLKRAGVRFSNARLDPSPRRVQRVLPRR
jgi:hypothetical protein